MSQLLAGEIPRAKAELAKHCTDITLTPEGDTYRLSGEWIYLEYVRMVPGARIAPRVRIDLASLWRREVPPLRFARIYRLLPQDHLQ